MGYIITAEFPIEDEVNATDYGSLLKEEGIRFLSIDSENSLVKVDIRGDFSRKAEITKYLCDCLIKHGIYKFSIGHSF